MKPDIDILKREISRIGRRDPWKLTKEVIRYFLNK
jgi:hypothetical protein